MLDSAIRIFLNDRIERRVEFKLKEYAKKNGEVPEGEKLNIENSANEEYELGRWLTYCSKNAGGVSLTTHPPKFSHPDANSSSVFCQSINNNSGHVQSGYKKGLDDVIFSTAAYMPIYTFLKLMLSDQREVMDHLVEDTDIIREQFDVVEDYDTLRISLLDVRVIGTDSVTNEKIKQVFFPVGDDYHLLSILSSSVMMFYLKGRVKEINSFDINKDAREAHKNNTFFSSGYKEIYDLTIQGHVKSNPQCISQLNKENFGESYLLPSIPPRIEKRDIHFPKTNFFAESIHHYDCRNIFQALHKILKTDYNNINIREGRDYRLQEVVDRIIEKMWAIRSVSSDQYHAETSQLKKHQGIWLCDEFTQEREESDKWLDTLCKEISQWVIRSYEKVMGPQAIKLGEAARIKITEIVVQNREALR